MREYLIGFTGDKEVKMLNQYLKYKREILYLVYGALTTMVNISAYLGLTQVAGMEYLSSNVIAWITSVIFAYITNRLYVFNSSGRGPYRIIKEFCAFTGCRLFSGLVDTTTMYLMIDLLKFNDLPVKIFANFLVIILNYGLSRQIVFQDNGQGEVSV